MSSDPITIQGTAYYYAYQPLSVTATPVAGHNFYNWQFDGAAPLISGLNPRAYDARQFAHRRG